MNLKSTATNYEWEAYSPYVAMYTGWGSDESDVCECNSKLCVDCSPVDSREATGLVRIESAIANRIWLSGSFWLKYYKIKRRVSRWVAR